MTSPDRMRFLKTGAWTVVLIAAVVFAVFFTDWISGRNVSKPPPQPPPMAVETPGSSSPSPGASSTATGPSLPGNVGQDTTINDTVLKGKQGKDETWELHSTSIHYDAKKKVTTASDILCKFSNLKTKQVVTIKAKSADVNMETQDVTFNGKVAASASTGELLEIENLRWEGKTKRFIGTESVKLTRGQSYMVGKEMVADANLQTVEIKGDVRIYLKDRDTAFGKSPMP